MREAFILETGQHHVHQTKLVVLPEVIRYVDVFPLRNILFL